MIADVRPSRRQIGNPKFGLALRIRVQADAMQLTAHPDPLLLYVVIGAAVAVGIGGGIVSSFREGIVGFLAFVLLFSPVITLLALNTARVRNWCVLDKARGLLEIDEQSYTRRVQESYPLRDVESIAVRVLPNAPLLGTANSFGLFICMRQIEYLAACSHNEGALSQDAWRMSRFLGVPLETPIGPVAVRPRRLSYRPILTAAAIYLVPTVLTVTGLLALFDRVPVAQPSFIGLLGAIIVSQVAAMLALAYYQTRRPRET
jgi:hypothetical protein